MRLIVEIFSKYLHIEAGDLEDAEEIELVTLPTGFQLPPEKESDDGENETPEVEC